MQYALVFLNRLGGDSLARIYIFLTSISCAFIQTLKLILPYFSRHFGAKDNASLLPLHPSFHISKRGVWNLFFWGIVCVYAFGVYWNAAFGIIDDHELTHSLLVGKNIDFFIMPNSGRFFPLDGQELNILGSLFGVQVSVFYAFNALCVFLVIVCLRFALRVFISHIAQDSMNGISQKNSAKLNFCVDCLLLILLFSPSFITSWLRLFVPERMEFVFLSIFMACYAYVLHAQDKAKYKLVFTLFVGVLCANFALYYKETAFAMLGSFAFIHLVFAWRTSNTPLKLFDFLLVLISALWLVVYTFVVLIHKQGGGFYGDTPYNKFLVVAKTAFSMACSEPFLFFLIFGALAYRIYALCVRKQRVNALLDACICASAVLMLEYLALRLMNFHYQLPAYIFGLVVIGYICLQWKKSKLLISGIVFCVLLWLGSSLFTSVYQAAHFKFLPPNFQSTLQFVSAYTQTHPHTRIFIEGVEREGGEVYVSFIRWLEYYDARNFDIASNVELDSRFSFVSNTQSPYSVFLNKEAMQPQHGDLMIITAFSINFHGLEDLLKNSEILYHANFGYNVPNIGIKSLLKNLIFSIGWAKNDVVRSQNVYGLPLHMYVLRVK